MLGVVDWERVHMTGFPVVGQLYRIDWLVHGRHEDDVYGQLVALDLSAQNWECLRVVLYRRSCGEIFRGLILSCHAMESRVGIHPSDWHVLRDCDPSLSRFMEKCK